MLLLCVVLCTSNKKCEQSAAGIPDGFVCIQKTSFIFSRLVNIKGVVI